MTVPRPGPGPQIVPFVKGIRLAATLAAVTLVAACSHAVVASMSGPLLRSGRVTTELLATSEGTRRVSRFDLEPSVVGILLWPLLGWLLKRDQARADRKQKALLEASSSDTAVG
jgi:hypothetical protein